MLLRDSGNYLAGAAAKFAYGCLDAYLDSSVVYRLDALYAFWIVCSPARIFCAAFFTLLLLLFNSPFACCTVERGTCTHTAVRVIADDCCCMFFALL